MPRFPSLALLVVALLAAGCARRAAEVPPVVFEDPSPVAAPASPPPPSPPAPPAPAAMYAPQARVALPPQPGPQVDTDRYAEIAPNPVQRVAEQPVSTFSVDVDTGSYSNVRRMLVDGRLPPADAVRAEELINYFRYDYPLPASPEVPFSVSTEVAPAPWDPRRHLLRIGIRGYDIDRSALPPANLVLLIDTSGSMHSPAKLPLLKQAFGQFVGQLRAQDRVAIVAYAGSAGMVLAPTPGDQHGEILAALGRLEAGGSTNGGAGLELAYALARQGFVEGGINRVLLATDGDFNVGTVDQGALETMVARQRATGVALSTLGFGTGNYNDAMAERLADLGDGNHAYIDSALEARRVLVEQMGSTLMTIARDVKVQVEFNPAQVAEYRLIGYENRLLRREDFDNDRVDAGDIGAGHTVTALYEIALAGSGGERIAPLRYAAPAAAPAHGDELAWLRLRYKEPRADASRLVETPIRQADMRAVPGTDFRFAAAVAAYADLLRGGAHVGGFGWDETIALAQGARGDDAAGERAEFLRLARHAQALEPVAAAAGAD